MSYCPMCGNEMHTNVCSKCGYVQNVVVDNGGFGWGLLGFCVPVAGLILFLVWNAEKPKTAKAAGLGALISVVGGILIYIVMIVLAIAFSAL